MPVFPILFFEIFLKVRVKLSDIVEEPCTPTQIFSAKLSCKFSCHFANVFQMLLKRLAFSIRNVLARISLAKTKLGSSWTAFSRCAMASPK